MFGFGGCHDSGGFCSDEFGSTHVEAYASAAFLAALAAVAVVVPFRRRPLPLLTAALAAAGIVAVLAVGAESIT